MFRTTLIAATLIAGAAHAATFDTTGVYKAIPQNSVAYVEDGMELTITGKSSPKRAAAPNRNGRVSQWLNGLGVQNGWEGWLSSVYDSYAIDNSYRTDWMIFRFDQKVSLTSMSFRTAEIGDAFKLFKGDGAGAFTSLGKFRLTDRGLLRDTVSFGSGFTGSVFAIAAARSRSWTGVSDFRVAGLTATKVNENVSLVPLPAPALLLLGGLAALAGIRRRA